MPDVRPDRRGSRRHEVWPHGRLEALPWERVESLDRQVVPSEALCERSAHPAIVVMGRRHVHRLGRHRDGADSIRRGGLEPYVALVHVLALFSVACWSVFMARPYRTSPRMA